MPEQTKIVSLSFYRFDGLAGRLWAFSQMAFARLSLPRTKGIGFWKLFGSGTGEGFTPVPNTAVYAILATWPDAETARAQTAYAPVYRGYQRRASEHWTVLLETASARGLWDGTQPFAASGAPLDAPLAALTRATLRKRTMLQFWKRVPRISDAIGADRNVAFKIGLGEVLWLQQVTFSIWPDTDPVAAFARRDGPHARAIRAVREGKWFREELYARFRIIGDSGTWNGTRPLGPLTDGAPPQ